MLALSPCAAANAAVAGLLAGHKWASQAPRDDVVRGLRELFWGSSSARKDTLL